MYELTIKFIDGEILILRDVTRYQLLNDNSVYMIEKNENKVFLNYEQVKYIGRSFDLNNCEVC